MGEGARAGAARLLLPSGGDVAGVAKGGLGRGSKARAEGAEAHERGRGKHMAGHNGHQEGGGIPRGTMDDARDLLERFAGEGQVLNREGTRRRVDFGQIIGLYIDPETGRSGETTMGIIHTSEKKGEHIVPARPRNWPWERGR